MSRSDVFFARCIEILEGKLKKKSKKETGKT
jgi:hypothetical protein